MIGSDQKIMIDKPLQLRKFHHIARDIGYLMWRAVGVGISIGLALWFVGIPSSPFLLALLGGSSVYLFGLTRDAAAQPRALFWCGTWVVLL
jgi:CBS-domain-containing membrane protein